MVQLAPDDYKGWCEKDDGIFLGYSLQLYQLVDALYQALAAATEWLQMIPVGYKFLMTLPGSGFSFEVADEFHVLKDFRLDFPKRYWKWYMYSRWFCVNGRLPKFMNATMNPILGIIRIFDPGIPGSEKWSYRNESGDYVSGIDYYGPGNHRKYYLTTDGVSDLQLFAMISAIVWVLAKMGFFKAIKRFISYMFRYSYKRFVREHLDEILEVVTDTNKDLEDLRSVLSPEMDRFRMHQILTR